MNKSILTLIAATLALSLSRPFAMAHDAGFNVFMGSGSGKIVDEGDIIIQSNQGREARITVDGRLLINGSPITVTAPQTVQLQEYAATVKDIEIEGMQLGKDATGFATGIVADVIAGLFTGEDEDRIDRKASDRAQTFKQKALSICNDVQSLKHIQDELVAGIAAFEPYALISAGDPDDYEHNINSDH